MRNCGLSAMLAAILLAACAGPGSVIEKLAAPPEPRHHRDFAEDAGRVCEASRYVLLGDGYVVQRLGADELVGAREFDVKKGGAETGYAHFRVYVTCASRGVGSTLFVTATEEHFGVEAIRDSTLIGLPLVSPISVGSRSEGDQQVKFHGETIEDQGFYDRFYQAVRTELAPAKAHEPAPQQAKPAP
jgi:hypothetical protein